MFFFILLPPLQLFHRDSWIHVIYMTDNLSNHKLVLKSLKQLVAVCSGLKKHNARENQVNGLPLPAFYPVFRQLTERVNTRVHSRNYRVIRDILKITGMSPEAFEERKDKGKVGVQKQKHTTYINAMHPQACCCELHCGGFSTHYLVCGTIAAH